MISLRPAKTSLGVHLKLLAALLGGGILSTGDEGCEEVFPLIYIAGAATNLTKR